MTFEELKRLHTYDIFEIHIDEKRVSCNKDHEFLTNAPHRKNRHPSMTFDVEKEVFCDFAVGEEGDVIDLYCWVFNKTRKQAYRELNDLLT